MNALPVPLTSLWLWRSYPARPGMWRCAVTDSAFLSAENLCIQKFKCKICAIFWFPALKLGLCGLLRPSTFAPRADEAVRPAIGQGSDRWKGIDVKLIIAAIKPFKLEEVREALTTIGVRGMMVTEIKGFGSQSGHTEIYRGAEYAVNFVPKVRLEIVVSDALAEQVVSTIAKTAKTDKIGDGKIFVLDVQHAVRVRTGEIDDDAL
jgi:nitrogen regulatory protein P-II 1